MPTPDDLDDLYFEHQLAKARADAEVYKRLNLFSVIILIVLMVLLVGAGWSLWQCGCVRP